MVGLEGKNEKSLLIIELCIIKGMLGGTLKLVWGWPLR